MRPPGAARPTATLFGQLLALIALSLIAANLINVWLIFSLPPPVPDIYRVSEVVRTFQGGQVDIGERRPLEVRIEHNKPGPSMMGRNVPAIRHELAQTFEIEEARIVIASSSRPPFQDRRVLRIVRDRMEREGVRREDHFLIAPFEVAVQRPDGLWEVVRPRHGLGLTPWQQRVVLWFLLSALVMVPIAYLFARRLSAPIRLFADAAERLGRDPRAPPLSLRGSAEIAVAARAFNQMQERLKRYVEDRTAMVGAIAHDLRTPLTRLRFRIESAPEDVRAKMVADIDQMEEMISAALTFVRDASSHGERTALELSSLVESIADEMAETGAKTEVEQAEKVVLDGDPVALRRLVTNLFENAVKFGGGARARVYKTDSAAIIEIDDDGPGIPAAEAERVFEPFYRREPSRSRKTGGAGLGLAVVRSVARGHGGDVSLINRPEGGLTARVELPL
ncbi:MAG: ATP-binding protein [Phenylobacterium sp.]|jgi:signal transduction histidine kinase|uniref:ATP-binding protein n=1 Tax=Phenylobacterium sp. TaxID=1871053 RepID=UPI002A35A87E|nr:ATP-binding protein [Phenylobacterium sp.]MDX9998318.1 ATP-binding protein [Phenylobacterium sp.]